MYITRQLFVLFCFFFQFKGIVIDTTIDFLIICWPAVDFNRVQGYLHTQSKCNSSLYRYKLVKESVTYKQNYNLELDNY